MTPPRPSGLDAASGSTLWTAYLLCSFAVLLLLGRGTIGAQDVSYLLGSAMAWWAGYYARGNTR